MARAEPGTGAGEAVNRPAKRDPLIDALRRLFRDRSASTAIEYGLIVALISVAMIVGLTAFSGTLKTTLLTVSHHLQTGK